MHLTISIQGDRSRNVIETTECFCIDSEGRPDAECRDCRGTGRMIRKALFWELRMHKENFDRMCRKLKLNPERGGVASDSLVEILGDHLKKDEPDNNSVIVLQRIAEEACQRGKPVVWEEG